MKIYNADSINVEQELYYEEMVEHALTIAKMRINQLKEYSHELDFNGWFAHDFILQNENLHESFIDYLKFMQSVIQNESHKKIIETTLDEYGVVEEMAGAAE